MVGMGVRPGLGRGSMERKSCPFVQLQKNGKISNTKILKIQECKHLDNIKTQSINKIPQL